MSKVLEEVLLKSGNAFIRDLADVGFEVSQFLSVTKMSLRKFLDYRNVLVRLTIPYNGQANIDLSEYMTSTPKWITRITIDSTSISYSYSGNGKIFLNTVLPGSCMSISYKSTNGLELLRLVDPNGDKDSMDNWELGFGEDDTRMSELIDLITANFMMTLGAAIRRFVISELPIGLDGDVLVSDGKMLNEDVIRQLQETSDCYDTVRAAPDFSIDYRGTMYAPLVFR